VEISVMSGGAAEPGLDFVAAAFRKKTGHTVRITYNIGTQAIKRMDAGEVVDVVVATSDSIGQNFRPAGKVEAGGVSIGRVGLGVMVRPGAPLPDLSGAEALKRTLLQADSLLYTIEASGLRIDEMIRKLGIHAQVEARIERFQNGPDLIDRVLKGKGREFGFLPITAILKQKDTGLTLVGPLPAEVQHYLELVAVPSTHTANREVAWEFVRFCGEQGKPLLAAHGVN
jgi:molybdate transport system substrate-binding protein